ncbi:MAG TPA: MlaD family protein, partial [Rhodothermales bacterium]
MKHSREIKVGAALIVAAILFFIGIRFFEDVPVFRGTYELYTEFDNAQGLTPGNAVRVQGVAVGAVESVEIDEQTRRVRVRF